MATSAWTVVRSRRNKKRAKNKSHVQGPTRAPTLESALQDQLDEIGRDNASFAQLSTGQQEQAVKDLVARIETAESTKGLDAWATQCVELAVQRQKDKQTTIRIMCYGVGRFARDADAMHQLAWLVRLRDACEGHVRVFEPLAAEIEIRAIARLGLVPLRQNDGGTAQADVFFVPHGPIALYEAMLWTHWDTLPRMVVIGNAFSELDDTDEWPCIDRARTHIDVVCACPVTRPSRVASAFSHTAAHTFKPFGERPKKRPAWEHGIFTFHCVAGPAAATVEADEATEASCEARPAPAPAVSTSEDS